MHPWTSRCSRCCPPLGQSALPPAGPQCGGRTVSGPVSLHCECAGLRGDIEAPIFPLGGSRPWAGIF
eukprot:6162723-Pyramimonas_sp.AAC.1